MNPYHAALAAEYILENREQGYRCRDAYRRKLLLKALRCLLG